MSQAQWSFPISQFTVSTWPSAPTLPHIELKKVGSGVFEVSNKSFLSEPVLLFLLPVPLKIPIANDSNQLSNSVSHSCRLSLELRTGVMRIDCRLLQEWGPHLFHSRTQVKELVPLGLRSPSFRIRKRKREKWFLSFTWNCLIDLSAHFGQHRSFVQIWH
jgi:hypothetical protein